VQVADDAVVLDGDVPLPGPRGLRSCGHRAAAFDVRIAGTVLPWRRS
jgi:hypothetical protein